MKNHENRLQVHGSIFIFCLGLWMGNFDALATGIGDAVQLISVSVPVSAQVKPRTVFTQTWTVQNIGTNSWPSGQFGYTLNLIGTDTLGAVPFSPNLTTNYHPFAVLGIIGTARSVAPNAEATFSMSFIAPETAGSYTDTFQIYNTSGIAFGPDFTVQVVVEQAGSTNQYDRARAVSYANNYAGCVVTDGYFWTDGSDYYDFGAGAPVPTTELGDDCAHFVSCCIGSQAKLRGAGLNIPSRVPPTYGEPGAARLVNTCLIAPGYATEVSSLSQMSPGDVIGWNWEGDTNIADLDHVTLYLGNELLASHAVSALDVSALSFFQTGVVWEWHLIHIYDAPTITAVKSGKNLVLSWGTNWTGYALYSATSLSPGAKWTKVSKSPTVVGALNKMTNAMSSTGSLYYSLVLP